jgi:hypothetical protein
VPSPVGDPSWSWPDRPGAAGWVVPAGAIVVAERGASALFLLHTTTPGAFPGTPQTLLAGAYLLDDRRVTASELLVLIGQHQHQDRQR